MTDTGCISQRPDKSETPDRERLKQNCRAALFRNDEIRAHFGLESENDLVWLTDKGLAHDHVRLGQSGWLARIPKQSQMALSASANLAYQKACFERAAASRHTPRLHSVLQPGPGLPLGALIVEEIPGRPAELPRDLDAIADCLASLHRLAVPVSSLRRPLRNALDAFADGLAELKRHQPFLDQAGIPERSRGQILDEIAAAWNDAALAEGVAARAPVSLISFDTHPGNYVLRPLDDPGAPGRAVLVDLEKARYGCAAFDLAHATLYSSTSWDTDCYSVLSHDDMAGFYERWSRSVSPALASDIRPWLLPLRRLMWLWSVTWCAKWQVESGLTGQKTKPDPKETASSSAENWHQDLSETELVRHVAERTRHYLDPDVIEQVRQDWRGHNALTDLYGGVKFA